ncbi:serine hydrolase domain-containing protein [Longispora sp. NPDC051575]|uniref:serine hydrolase domain-containing protein n=1 Tax=Longispora sp. NPDC051575 TaxID=3154943 RepID=UPI0034131172
MRRVSTLSVVLAVVALVGAACGGDPDKPPAADPTPPGYAATLRPALQTILDGMRVPGAVVMVTSKDKGDWTEAFGTRALTGDLRVTAQDHFRIGSNTKTLTGTVVLQLAQEGKLALADPVSKYRPDVPNGDNITVTQLLDMRSGLYNYSEDEQFNVQLDTNPGRVWKQDELLAIAFGKQPYFAPGTGFHYSNTNTILLGLIIEKLTGRPLRDEFRTRIFEPVGMPETRMPVIDDVSIPAPHPRGYLFGTNVSTLTDAALPAAEQAAAKAGTLLPTDHTADSPSWTWAAGGAISTAGDLTRYVQALVGGGLLDAATQKLRFDSVRPADPANPGGAGYGLGIAKFDPLYGHDGQLPGFNSFMAGDPDRGVTVVVLTSLTAGPDGRQPANILAMAIIRALYPEPAPTGSPS